MQDTITHTGHCHCKAVTFEVMAPANFTAYQCNCSICEMCGFEHLIVEKSEFKLLTGKEDLALYRFNTKTAKHYFCKHCGIKPFYIPRSHPDGVSVNARCIDTETIKEVTRIPFDGKNWEKNVAAIQHK